MRAAFRATLMFLTLVAAPTPGRTEPPPPAVAPAHPNEAPAPAEAIALVKRYFVAIQLDKRMDGLLASVVPFEIDEVSKSIDGLTPDQRSAVAAATTEAAKEWYPKYFDEVAQVYAKVFTLDELQAMVSFYESPVGQAIVAKSGKLTPAAMQIMQQDLPELKALIGEHLCRHLDCTKLKRRPIAAAA